LQDKFEEALETLDSYKKPWSGSHAELYSQMRFRLLKKLGKWRELHEIYETMLLAK
jgi:hypothetical protein